MQMIKAVCLLLVVGWSFLGTPVWAFDVGWLQKGVRVWYFGGVGTGMSSDAEEAYLLGAINGANVPVTHHSGLNHWVSTNPVSTATYSLLDKNAPCWIHPVVLQNLQIGDRWKGLEITKVTRSAYTYNTFLNTALPAPNHFLPIKALFDLKTQRDLVNIVYKIDDYGSSGAAYFDAETGLALYYNSYSAFVTYFFILSEINYDFARKRAFAEDYGPHTGFKSQALETSSTSQYVQIQSMVETRYGNTMALQVLTSFGGSKGVGSWGDPVGGESYCFFGDIPILRHINWSQRMTLPPEQWNPFGEYLFWWLPPTALSRAAINVYDVAMASAGQPLTFTSTESPLRFYFTNLCYGNYGYLTQFFAKDPDPAIGLDLNNISQNLNSVTGPDYYRNVMGRAIPVTLSPGVGALLFE